MKSFRPHGFARDLRSVANAVPVALLIFFTFCYLVLASNIVAIVENKLLMSVVGLTLYVLMVALVRGVTNLWLRGKEERALTKGHLVRGIDRVAFAYVVWSVSTNLFPNLSLMSSNNVMTSTEKLWIESVIIMYVLGSVYLVWYMVLGKNEKLKSERRQTPKIDN